MVTVSRRGTGPVIVAALVAAAFLLGLVRPWDWLAGAPPSGDPDPRSLRAVGTAAPGRPPSPGATAAPVEGATCGYPSSWRTASISFWAGARAHIWTAARAVPANGPDDPAIPFHAIASDTVEAIGWCAPVTGPERPPLTADGTLYRLRGGAAVEVPTDLLEPAAGDALGELWVPVQRAVGRRPPWPPGLYVIRLATPSGTYERYLGIDVGVPPRPRGTTPTAAGSAGPSPGASASPGAGASPVAGAPPGESSVP